MIKEKFVFGLKGKLILKKVPDTYYLAGINTNCVVCNQQTNNLAKHKEQTRPCCEKCFDTKKIDSVFIDIRKTETGSIPVCLGHQAKVINLFNR